MERFTYGVETTNKGYLSLTLPITESQIKELAKLFNHYKSAGIDLESSAATDMIQGNGALKFQEDIGVKDDDDPLLMVVAWKLQCETMWEFSRQEWMDGFTQYGVSTIKEIKAKAEEWKKEVQGSIDVFKIFYNFVFDYLKGDKRILEYETCELVWGMLLKPRNWKLYEKWMEFLKKENKKAISKDAWQQLIEFTLTYPNDVTHYDEMAAWPLLFDEFAEWMNGGQTAGGDGDGDDYDY